MWYDNGGKPHPSPSDPVTGAGLAHIDRCPTCKFLLGQVGPIKVELGDETRYLGSTENERIRQLAAYGFTVDSIVRPVQVKPAVAPHVFRRSLRCWAGFHNWYYQVGSDLELCVRCGKEERLY